MLERAMRIRMSNCATIRFVQEVLGVDEKDVHGLKLKDVEGQAWSASLRSRVCPGHRPRAECKNVYRQMDLDETGTQDRWERADDAKMGGNSRRFCVR